MNNYKKIPIIIIILGTILDLTSTTALYLTSQRNPLKPFTEINPLYHFLGNYWIFLIINILLIGYLIWWYNKLNTKPQRIIQKYTMFTLLLITGLIRILAAINNYAVLQTPPLETIEQAQQVSAQVEQQSNELYSKATLILLILPIFLLLINFILFTKAHKLKIKEGEKRNE